MATLSTAGIGSGLDVASLVQQLVSAERAPSENRIKRNESTTNLKISAVAALKNALSGLDTALTALRDGKALGAHTATSSDPKIFTATADASAASGSYRIEVLERASTHRLASAAFTDADSTVGSGTLAIASGDDSFNVAVAPGATLAQLRDAINSASDNPGVRATLTRADDGVRLVLTSNSSGSGGALKLTSSGGDGGLQAFAYDPGAGQLAMQEIAQARDARVAVDGFVFSHRDNRVEGAIDGITIDLLDAAPGTQYDLTVAEDGTAATAAVQAFTTAWNQAMTTLTATTRYDPASRTAAVFNGDSMLRGAARELRSAIGSAYGEGIASTLASLGITTSTDGKLTADSAKLQAALSNNGSAVRALFEGPDGVGAALDKTLERLVGTGGALPGRADQLRQRMDDFTDQRLALDRRMEGVEARYRAQFTALDALVGKLQSTSSFLSQQLAGL